MTAPRLYLAMFGSFVVGLVASSDRLADGQAFFLSGAAGILMYVIAIIGGRHAP